MGFCHPAGVRVHRSAIVENHLAVSTETEHTHALCPGGSPQVYPAEVQTYAHRKACTRMSTTTLFTKAKNWKLSNVHQHQNG